MENKPELVTVNKEAFFYLKEINRVRYIISKLFHKAEHNYIIKSNLDKIELTILRRVFEDLIYENFNLLKEEEIRKIFEEDSESE